MTKSSSSKKKREGYQVGVFKHGKLKHIMELGEASNYVREKQRKIKESKPKRECSKAQLEALARGRAIREKNRDGKGGGLSAPKPRVKSAIHAKETKAKSKSKQNKARVRREKELSTGKHRSHESQYDSDTDHSDGRNHRDESDSE